MAIVVYYSEKEERRVPDGVDGVRSVTRTPKMGTPKYNVSAALPRSPMGAVPWAHARLTHASLGCV